MGLLPKGNSLTLPLHIYLFVFYKPNIESTIGDCILKDSIDMIHVLSVFKTCKWKIINVNTTVVGQFMVSVPMFVWFLLCKWYILFCRKSPGSAVPSEMPGSWEEDMDYVFGLQGQSQVLGSLWLQHCVRGTSPSVCLAYCYWSDTCLGTSGLIERVV